MNRLHAILVALLLLGASGGCAVTDTGNPPLAPPDPSEMSSVFFNAGLLSFSGGPGAVPTGEGVLRITDLSSAAAPVDAEVAADGSFGVMIFADADAVFRLQHVVGTERSLPLDVMAGSLAPPASALPCLELTTEFVVGSISERVDADVAVTNGCEVDITLEARRRSPDASLRLEASVVEAVLEPSESTVVRLRVEPPSSEAEAVVLVELDGSSDGTSEETRAVTVRASAL